MSGDAQLTALESALDALEGQGARGYDAPACDCVRNLLVRAEALNGHARALLLRRVQDHFDRLEARFERDRERATARVEVMEKQGSIAPGALSKSLERGELDRIHRAARRVRRSEANAGHLARRTTRAELKAARRRAALRYEDSAAELVGMLALSRSRLEVPEDAGPYNVHRIAHRTLETLRAESPLYLRAQLERLEELGSLMELPPLEVPEPPPPPKRGRSGARRGARKRR